MANNDLQNITQKTKDRATRIIHKKKNKKKNKQKPGMNSGAPEG